MARVLFALIAFYVGGCSLGPGCGEVRLSNSASPDGLLFAEVFERDCGATTDFSRMVYIRRAKDGEGTSKHEPIFIVSGQKGLELAWEGERHLTIACAECDRNDIFKQESVWGDVEVRYSIIPAP